MNAEQLINQLIEASVGLSKTRKFYSFTPLDQATPNVRSLARSIMKNPSKYGIVKDYGDLVIKEYGEVIYHPPEGWNLDTLAAYLKYGSW